jgi:hypothetical protein
MRSSALWTKRNCADTVRTCGICKEYNEGSKKFNENAIEMRAFFLIE